jgi:hypothetical protein
MNFRTSTVVAVALVVALPSLAAETYSHQEYFEHYEGTATCLKCHEDGAEAFFASQHYQWRGATPNVVNGSDAEHGKLTMVNDFCTNPVPSWIGEVRNQEGTVLASGCSKCHAGLGLMPSPVISREQLENIDCLICHAAGYQRGVFRNDDGSWEWRPILWKNKEGLDSVSKRISKPTRTMCLRCHSASGGGPNYKRGDLEYTLTEPAREFDVHMSEDGAGLHCIGCHSDQNHRVKGRGADLASNDSPGSRLSCDSGACHDAAPHVQELLNRHVARISCSVCHIPSFARDEPTDMVRDWSTVHFSEEKGKYLYAGKLESNVVPSYAWYNGSSRIQLPRQKVERDATGAVMMAIPQGGKEDPSARLAAFKVHRAKLPVLDDTGWLLPVSVDELYLHGDVDRAVADGTERLYGIREPSYTWSDTVRFMSINHGVRPAEYALGCLDCHGPDSRLDWTALGYAADPLAGCLAPAD